MPQNAAAARAPERYHSVVEQYCVWCHNEKLKTGGLSLEKVDLRDISGGADVWEKVVRKLGLGMMPPQGRPKPDDATRGSMIDWLETSRRGRAKICTNSAALGSQGRHQGTGL